MAEKSICSQSWRYRQVISSNSDGPLKWSFIVDICYTSVVANVCGDWSVCIDSGFRQAKYQDTETKAKYVSATMYAFKDLSTHSQIYFYTFTNLITHIRILNTHFQIPVHIC